ncbi:DUF1036 domain-containing protein [Algimonas arctica]|uniref:DUF1036 domain-containing protein n=1 Tax=Algimonas arctica TaxID=1479486 RepID=UPI001672F5CE|nr:DUF1036 domain-containing protein [Algimonas arctica]
MRRGSITKSALTILVSLGLAGSAAAQDAATVIPADPTLVGQTTEWQVCNETSYVLRTASAFLRGGGMAAKGWNEVLPGACIIITTPVSGPRFLFAESIAAHQGGVREWKGTTPLCVDETTDFTSSATQDCRLSNRTERNFFAVRPGEPVTSLVEPSEFGRTKSVVAAQQRLLRDAGYAITRIDGLPGRKTSRLLRAFRKDHDLDATVSDEPLMRALIAAAQDAQDSVGLEVCNQSSAAIWTAVATLENGKWRSRGWWRAAPEECTRPLDIPLPGTEAHVFAVQEGEDGADKRLRTVATTPAQFCIAESKFDALGKDMCIEQGYAVASFRPVPTEDRGARMRLSDADFSEQTPGGLRR